MRGGLAAMGRLRFNRKKEAKAAGQFFANAGFVGTPIPAGNDAVRGEILAKHKLQRKNRAPKKR